MTTAGETAFAAKWSLQAWTYTCVFALNSMFSCSGSIAPGKWSKLEKRAISAIGVGVQRFLAHGQVKVPADDDTIEQLKRRRVNYKGEEVGVCHRLTLAQVLPALL